MIRMRLAMTDTGIIILAIPEVQKSVMRLNGGKSYVILVTALYIRIVIAITESIILPIQVLHTIIMIPKLQLLRTGIQR